MSGHSFPIPPCLAPPAAEKDQSGRRGGGSPTHLARSRSGMINNMGRNSDRSSVALNVYARSVLCIFLGKKLLITF